MIIPHNGIGVINVGKDGAHHGYPPGAGFQTRGPSSMTRLRSDISVGASPWLSAHQEYDPAPLCCAGTSIPLLAKAKS